MAKSWSVEAGALFEADGFVWRVLRFLDAPGRARHAVLQADGDATRVKTVSLSALADRRLFSRLAADPAPARMQV